MKTEKHDRNIHRVIHDIGKEGALKLLLISDVHYDSLKCDRELLTKHLDKAKDDDALIIVNGDWFDVMGCKRDPRSQTNQIRHDYLHHDKSYLDAVVEDSFEFLKPYAEQLLLMGYGNHTTNILKRKETDPLGTLIFLLNNSTDHHVYKGGYSGVIAFKLSRHGGNHSTKVLQYHHGHGGNAHRTKGMLDVDLDAAKWPDADIVIKGHDHNKWYTSKLRKSFNTQSMKRYESTQHHIRLGSYKKLGDGHGGWSTEKGHEPKKRGGWWLTFNYKGRDVVTDVQEAH